MSPLCHPGPRQRGPSKSTASLKRARRYALLHVMAIEREYTYRARWATVSWTGLFFGFCTAFMGWKARTNSRGLVINGVIELAPTGATAFYWVIAGLSAAFVLAAILVAVLRVVWPRRLVLAAHELLVPRFVWSKSDTRIPYSAITGIEIQEVSGQKFAHVRHASGRATITASLLPRKEDFDDVVRLLEERRRACSPPAT